MTGKKYDKNARAALNQFKYEIANELNVDTINSDLVGTDGKINTKKLAEAAKNQMGNQ